MTHASTRPPRTPRHRPALLAGTAVAAGVALGMGGGTFALWQDSTGFTLSAHSGYEYFAAGAPGATQPATDGTVRYTVDPNHAKTLRDNGEVAFAIQTESVSQGNKGLRYSITEPDWGDHIFGAASTNVFHVNSPEECSLEAHPRVSDERSSTPVAAEYSASEEPIVETWCVVATLDELPDQGSYSNSVTVTAKDSADEPVKATDSWHAEVTSSMDPADEPQHTFRFEYETFRPGE